MALTGCTKAKTPGDSTNFLFDPKVPGGSIGNTLVVGSVTNLTVDSTVTGQITLSWKIPSVYVPLPYTIRIYKNPGPLNQTLPDPTQLYTSAGLFKVAELPAASCPIETSHVAGTLYSFNSTQIASNCTTWTETATTPTEPSHVQGVLENTTYSYSVFIYLKNTWGPAVTGSTTTPNGSAGFTLPPANKFWQQKAWDYGNAPFANSSSPAQKTQSYSTLEPKKSTCSLMVSPPTCSQLTGCEWDVDSSGVGACNNESFVGHMKGKTATAYDGAVLYVADTDNNRVVVYERTEALACVQYKNDPVTYQACQFNSQGVPFSAVNILGEPDQYSNSGCNVSCQAPAANATAAACGAVSGCAWQTKTLSCQPTFTYDQCLNKPNYITVDGNNLIITDSGNNRLVVWDHLPIQGCDPNIIAGQTTQTDCNAKTYIGKTSFSDFNNYAVATYGRMSFSNPTGTTVLNGNIYVADTNNNRVVKINNYSTSSNGYSCNLTNFQSQNFGACAFSSVLGQPSFNVKIGFKDYVATDVTNQQTCAAHSSSSVGTITACQADSIGCQWTAAQISGQGTCSLASPLFDSLGIGNIISSPYSYVLKRFFANPTVVKFSDSGKLLVSSNEYYAGTSTIGTPIYMKGRILIWDNNPIGDTPTCTSASFGSAGCDATAVVGQADFKTLISVQGSAAKYSDVVYGLESIDDFDIYGNVMVGVDSVNNFVYEWSDFTSTTSAGRPPTYRVINPMGASNPNGSTNLPFLKGISAITILPGSLLIYVTDPGNYKVYEVRAYSITR